MQKEIDIHPYTPFISMDSTKLIIGTIPPSRFCKMGKFYASDVEFYYGSRDNHFWDILSDVFNIPLTRGTSTSITERKRILESNKIAVCDILVKAKRKNEDSASDSDLIIEDNSHFLDLELLLKNHPNITTLIYTSLKVKSFIYQKTKREHRKNDNNLTLCLNNKQPPYEVIILPSPSRRNTMDYASKVEEYRKVLSN